MGDRERLQICSILQILNNIRLLWHISWILSQKKIKKRIKNSSISQITFIIQNKNRVLQTMRQYRNTYIKINQNIISMKGVLSKLKEIIQKVKNSEYTEFYVN